MALPRSKMKLSRREHDDLLIFDLSGDLDTAGAGPVKEEIRNAIDEGARRILINLEGVPYIDSAGLGARVSVLKRAREQGGTVWLCALGDQVRMVIELTRLQNVFDIFRDVDEAIAEILDEGGQETE